MKPRLAVVVSGVASFSLIVGLAIGVFAGSRAATWYCEDLEHRYEQAMAELTRLRAEQARATRNWRRLLMDSKRTAARQTGNSSEVEEPKSPAEAEAPPPGYDFATLKAQFERGNFNRDGIITAEGIEKTLEKNGRWPGFLVAAALLSRDVESTLSYLEEALEKEPDSRAALLAFADTLVRSGETGESARAAVQDLMAADPTNSLVDYYAAYLNLKSGDVQAAMAQFTKAGSKIHLNDYALSYLPEAEAFYRDAGCSSSVAKILAMTGSRLDYLPLLRDLAGSALEEANRRHDRGELEQALSLTRSSAQIGNRLSTSGRHILHDLVGIAIEDSALEQERGIYEALENRLQLQEIERRLQNNALRKEQAKVISRVFREAFLELSEYDMERYFSRVVTEGETAVARELPRVREALASREE